MTRQQIIENLKDEERRAIVMGCTDDYIDMLEKAYTEIEKLQQIDALMNDSVYEGVTLIAMIRGILNGES